MHHSVLHPSLSSRRSSLTQTRTAFFSPPFKPSHLNVNLNRKCSRSGHTATPVWPLGTAGTAAGGNINPTVGRQLAGATAYNGEPSRRWQRAAGTCGASPQMPSLCHHYPLEPNSPPPDKRSQMCPNLEGRSRFCVHNCGHMLCVRKQLPALLDGATIQTVNKLELG